MIDFSQILMRPSGEGEASNSLIDLTSSGTFTENSKNETIYRIKIPFVHFHRASTVVKIENRTLLVETKLQSKEDPSLPMETSNIKQNIKLPIDLNDMEMIHYFDGNDLIVEIPMSGSARNESENYGILKDLSGKLSTMNIQSKSLKYSVDGNKLIITEDFGFKLQLPNVQLKVTEDGTIHLVVKESSLQQGSRTNVSINKQYTLRHDLYEIEKATATIEENQVLKLYIPIKNN